MSNIFELYTAQQIREMYFEDEWPHDYGFRMDEFTGEDNVRYTDKGPQLLLFDMHD